MLGKCVEACGSQLHGAEKHDGALRDHQRDAKQLALTNPPTKVYALSSRAKPSRVSGRAGVRVSQLPTVANLLREGFDTAPSSA